MNIIEKMNKQVGIYPILPSMTVELGDYGYWDKYRWCHFGNIKNDFRKISFTEKVRPINQRLEVVFGATVTGNADGCLSALKDQGKAEIQFNKNDSLYYEAELTEELCYPAIKGELEPFLRTIPDWNSNYWIVVSVVKANNYVTLFSHKAGARICVEGSGMVGDENLADMRARVSFAVSGSTEQVQSIVSIGKENQIAGMRFIKFTRNNIFLRERKISYTGENEGIDMESISEDKLYSL